MEVVGRWVWRLWGGGYGGCWEVGMEVVGRWYTVVLALTCSSHPWGVW